MPRSARLAGSITDRVVLRNRVRSVSLGVMAAGWAVLWAWAASRSPDGPGDIVLYVLVVTPVFALFCRLASEGIVADPFADEVRIRNLLRTHRVRWDDVATFEVTRGRLFGLRSQWLTCVQRRGVRIHVRGAGRWLGGPNSPSMTTFRGLSRTAQELEVRRTRRPGGPLSTSRS